MRIFSATVLRLAAPLLGAALSLAHAAEKEKIEFSGEVNKPATPKAGPRLDEIEGRLGNINSGGGIDPSGGAPLVPPTAPTLNKRALEKLLLDYDKKKNWMVPGAQEIGADLSKSKWEKAGMGLEEEKEKPVLEKFFEGDKKRTRDGRGLNSKDPERDELDADPDNLELNTDDFGKKSSATEIEANGFKDFNLKSYLNPGQTERSSTEPFVGRPDNSLRNFQAIGQERFDNRRAEREKEAARSAEFEQMIKPRGGGPTIGAGAGSASLFRDPINSQPDITRRELNPVSPLSTPGSDNASRAFNLPSPRPSGITDSSMFGIASPAAAASSITPSFAPPASTPIIQGNFAPGSIILERPKRPF